MCGIVGYVGTQDAAPFLLDALKRLEYRGYDSAGLAIAGSSERLFIRRSVGKIRDLERTMRNGGFHGNYGIGHTRWATHGRPTKNNAHPHSDCHGNVAVVHNGVIDNYLELKKDLEQSGHRIRTDTDTEIIAHLIEGYASETVSVEHAVRLASLRLKGEYSFVALSRDKPNKIVVVRHGPPIIVGFGDQEYFVASDIPAIVPFTRDILCLENDDVAVITREGLNLVNLAGDALTRSRERVGWTSSLTEKGNYQHFMLKEIFEQPRAVTETLRARWIRGSGQTRLDDIGFSDRDLAQIRQLTIAACGTSWHAGLVGKFMIEELAGLPVEVDYASEFRYRNPLVDEHTLTVAISQSGETADTLGAQREARRKGSKTLAICNTAGSNLTREADGTLLTQAGPEIGVASTKAFTSQLIALLLLAAHLGQSRGSLSGDASTRLDTALANIDEKITTALRLDSQCRRLATKFSEAAHFMFLGRGIHYPIALEGALKLKEISYIHADGYPAGEMKHGPNALIDGSLPAVVLCTRDPAHPQSVAWYQKTLGNIREVQARGASVIAVATEGDNTIRDVAEHVIEVPEADHLIQPILEIVPLQLLAYEIAMRRGCDIDQPRNLAKSVTVE